MTPTIYSPGDYAFNRLGECIGPLKVNHSRSTFPLRYEFNTFTSNGQFFECIGPDPRDLIEKWDGKFKAGDVVGGNASSTRYTVVSTKYQFNRWWLIFGEGSNEASLYRLISRPVENLLISQVEKPFRIEEGKFYRTRDGRKAGPIKPITELGKHVWVGTVGDLTCLWQADGTNYDPGSGLNLVSEWKDPIPDPVPAREDAMVVVSRKVDGTPDIWCDPEIADLVTALNKGGMRTVASCCGHGQRPGNIALADGRELLIAESFEQARSFDAMFNGVTVATPPIFTPSFLSYLGKRFLDLPADEQGKVLSEFTNGEIS